MNHKSNKVHRLVVRRTDINIIIDIGKWGELLKLFINLIWITFHKYYKSTNNNSIIRSFDYVFEINAFLDDAHAGSNIVKQLKKRPYTRSKGYVFRYIQDIDNEKLNN